MKKSIILLIFSIFVSCGEGGFDIHDAIEANDFQGAKRIVEAGIDLNDDKICIPQQIETWGGMCPMHHVALTGNQNIMQMFLDNGADINKKALNKDEAPPVAWAIFFCNFKSVEWLVEKGANLNYVDTNSIGPLGAARFSICQTDEERKEMYEYLEGKGAKQ